MISATSSPHPNHRRHHQRHLYIWTSSLLVLPAPFLGTCVFAFQSVSVRAISYRFTGKSPSIETRDRLRGTSRASRAFPPHSTQLDSIRILPSKGCSVALRRESTSFRFHHTHDSNGLLKRHHISSVVPYYEKGMKLANLDVSATSIWNLTVSLFRCDDDMLASSADPSKFPTVLPLLSWSPCYGRSPAISSLLM